MDPPQPMGCARARASATEPTGPRNVKPLDVKCSCEYAGAVSSPAFQPRPLERGTAAQQIAAQIRDAMRSGRLSAGERLPSEHELAAEYQVSRPTVREALRLLAAARLVEATRGAAGGTFVALPAPGAVAASLSETIELWFQAGSTTAAEVDHARAWIERGCVRLAAEQRTDDDLADIASAVERARDPSI